MMASTLIRELRHGFRALSRKPGFSLVVVATLALAIGASTIIYGIVHGVLLAALPYPEPERLVGVWQVGKNGGQGQFSDPNFEDLRDQTRTFSAIAEYATGTVTVSVGDTPSRVEQATVSRQFFDAFGTRPVRGRTFTDEELTVGAAPVAVVSDGFWRRNMSGADPAGTPIRIGDQTLTVVGVMPPSFQFPPHARRAE